MDKFDYSRPIATAQRLIKRFGQSLTLRVSSNSGDAWNPTITDTDYSITGVVLDYMNKEIDGTLIQATDKKVILSTEDVTVAPSVEHKLVVGSVVHSVADVTELNPGGTVVYWEARVRK